MYFGARGLTLRLLYNTLVLVACAPDSSVPAGGTRLRTKTEGASFVRSRSLAAVARWRLLWRGAETSSPQLLPYPLPTPPRQQRRLFISQNLFLSLYGVRTTDFFTKLTCAPPPTNRPIPIQESVAFFHEFRPRMNSG